MVCMAGQILLEHFLEHLIVGDDELEVGFCNVELDFEVCFGFVGFTQEGGLSIWHELLVVCGCK